MVGTARCAVTARIPGGTGAVQRPTTLVPPAGPGVGSATCEKP